MNYRSGKNIIKVISLLGVLALMVAFATPAGFVMQKSFAAEGYEDVASSSDTASVKPVEKYGMVPIYARDIKDGTYNVEMESSSSFFHIADAKLTVAKNKMTVVFQIGSASYRCVYPGTAEEAAKAPLEDYVMAEESDLGTSFEIPVEALNKGMDLAAFSRKKKKWYDRKVIINASSLPEDAVDFDVPDYDRIESAIELYDKENGTSTEKPETDASEEKPEQPDSPAAGSPEPVDLDMKDGIYSIEVILTGGSGRASVSSPTWLIVKDGKAYTKLLWSSSYYDFMMVGGQKYTNESEDGGNSTFTIPITAFDTEVPVIGDTTAMGDPVAIDYKLTFYKDTINSRNKIPQEAAKGVIAIAAAVAILGGILNYVLKKRNEKKIYHKR